MKIHNGPNNWLVVKIVMTQPYYHGQISFIRKLFIESSILSVEVSHVCFSINIQIALVIFKINRHTKGIPFVSQIVILICFTCPYSVKIYSIVLINYRYVQVSRPPMSSSKKGVWWWWINPLQPLWQFSTTISLHFDLNLNLTWLGLFAIRDR